jgi:nitroimidazol reductase NimA-like FMN-containing flavoprotein (pyridoxamine 5'-phosphate oxidase superfamily)
MALARAGSNLLLHGSVASRALNEAGGGLPVCVTVTHLDALVLARSAFHSSMNYRSVMVFGQASLVTDAQEKAAGLDALVEHLVPGRLAEIRPSTRKELNATSLLSLPIADIGAPVWAGVIPLTMVAGEPEGAPDLEEGIAPPGYLAKL